jgi:hypothetical protein
VVLPDNLRHHYTEGQRRDPLASVEPSSSGALGRSLKGCRRNLWELREPKGTPGLLVTTA